jgi:hypothetical protein
MGSVGGVVVRMSGRTVTFYVFGTYNAMPGDLLLQYGS